MQEEIEFLKALRFRGKHPTPLFYYRELQNLRDPLHFRDAVLQGRGAAEASVAPEAASGSKTPLAS